MNTRLYKITDPEGQKKEIEEIAALIKSGEAVAIPTETVYGIAADCFNDSAVEKIYLAKGRPSDNPLIVHISRFEEIYSLVDDKSSSLPPEPSWGLVLPSSPAILSSLI